MSKCIVCDKEESVPFYKGIARCQACGYVFADLQLSQEELFTLYRKNYFFGEEYSDYLADQDVLRKNFSLRMRTLNRFLQSLRHRHLFEIGSAYGMFLDLVRPQFASVSGIDITEDGVRYAREHLYLDVTEGNFLDYPCSGKIFDVVCLWDTIEHLQSPHLYLEKLNTHTTPGALLALTTGDIESLNARWKKEAWRLLHPPTHLHYFSKKTIAQLLEKYGFSVIYNRYCGFYRSFDNIAYNIFVLRKQKPWLYNLMKASRITHLNCYMNLYDIMFVIAQRR